MSFSAPAQNFAIPWHTIDSGGGVSRGASFELSGTLGQPDARASANGQYQLVSADGQYGVLGGFWGVVRTMGADCGPGVRLWRGRYVFEIGGIELGIDFSHVWNEWRDRTPVWNYEGDAKEKPLGEGDDLWLTLDQVYCTNHFRLFYSTTDPVHGTDLDYIRRMAGLFEEAWEQFFEVQDFRDPLDLQAEFGNRYTLFPNFERIPVLVYDAGSGYGHAGRSPLIDILPDLAVSTRTPLHELFHVVHKGYTHYSVSWFNEGLARWSEKFKPDYDPLKCENVRNYYGPYRPLTYNFLTGLYCQTAVLFEYFSRKYSRPAAGADGSDVVQGILEELEDASGSADHTALLAFERALDAFDRPRASGYGNAFAEWAAGNYVDDTDADAPPALRSGAPLRPRQKEGGRVMRGEVEPRREYSFQMSASGTVTIQVRASAGDLDEDGDDDDLRFLLDGAVIADWNTRDAFDGSTLGGKLKTVHLLQPDLAAGTHTLTVEADEQPILYSIDVFEGDVKLLYQSSPAERPARFFDKEFLQLHQFDVPADGTDVTIYLTGLAQSAETNNIVEGQNEDDDARLKVDLEFVGDWETEDTLDGAYQEGDMATVTVLKSGLAEGVHTLKVYVDGRPTISEVAIFATPARLPLLQMRTPKLDLWGVNYHVLGMTGELIGSGDTLAIQFNTIQWGDDLSPPFTELLEVNADGTGRMRADTRRQDWSVSRSVFNHGLLQIGDGGRLVHITSGIDQGGTFELVVSRIPGANNAPVLAHIPDPAIAEGNALNFSATAADDDVPAQRLTYWLMGVVPGGARIDPDTGLFSWTPDEDQGPGVYRFNVGVTDDGWPQRSDFQTLTVTVTETNSTPVVAAIADQTVDEWTLLSFNVTATDPDIPANTLLFALEGDVPDGAVIDSDTGRFEWVPNERQGRSEYRITVRVTDDGSPNLSEARSFTVTVNEVNGRPHMETIANQIIHAGSTLNLRIAASDVDLPPNVLTYALVQAPPGAIITTASGPRLGGNDGGEVVEDGAELSVSAAEGVFAWTPTEAQVGTHAVTVRVTDNGTPNLRDEKSFSITVASPPAIASMQVTNGTVRISWNAVPGHTYRVQYKSRLDETAWTDVPGEVTATGPIATKEDAIGLAPQRFYRVGVLPCPVVTAVEGYRNWEGPSRYADITDGVQDRGVPPDPIIAVGPNHVITAVKDDVYIYDKADGSLIAQVDMNTFFTRDDNCFDPKVAYDPFRGRFLILYLNTGDPSHYWALAVSKTGTPTGDPNDWWKHLIRGSTDDAPGDSPATLDYPELGFDYNAVYLSAFLQLNDGSGWDSKLCILNKDQIYQGPVAGNRLQFEFSLKRTAAVSSSTSRSALAVASAAADLRHRRAPCEFPHLPCKNTAKILK